MPSESAKQLEIMAKKYPSVSISRRNARTLARKNKLRRQNMTSKTEWNRRRVGLNRYLHACKIRGAKSEHVILIIQPFPGSIDELSLYTYYLYNHKCNRFYELLYINGRFNIVHLEYYQSKHKVITSRQFGLLLNLCYNNIIPTQWADFKILASICKFLKIHHVTIFPHSGPILKYLPAFVNF
jgi:hypothetical protein